ncbi:uncharacterized protein [Spinacia oleracea]|uniref:Endonuclease/exonuclease/phosphatase domain-containing protein n=1 Tax=Spinacia oleracea TaxID=3562 RepID=A0ABM3QQ84_SPIOL|nr:uncharacterized protein LOC110788583 [Spinacia oleracea]
MILLVCIPPCNGSVVTEPNPWKIVARRTKGFSKMRTLSPNNPFSVLSGELEFKEISGGDLEHEEVDKSNQPEPPNEEDTGKDMWSFLLTLATSVGSYLWLITGDFNSPLCEADRINGYHVFVMEVKDFDDFITVAGLFPLKSVGHYFSWHTGIGDGKIASRIDWCLGNADWIHKYSSVHVDYLNPSISDHYPLLINCLLDKPKGGRPFRFLNYLVEHSKFTSTIQTCKLKEVKISLKRLHIEELSGITGRINQARSELDEVQNAFQAASLPELLVKEVVCVENLRKWLRVDEISLRQNSRIQWLQLGDSNNQFFFSTSEILAFYEKLLGTSASSLPSIHIPTVRSGPRLTNSAKRDLCKDVTNEEIDLAIKGIGNDKAPGPDGLNAVFFKKSWPITKQDIYKAVKEFFSTNTMLP